MGSRCTTDVLILQIWIALRAMIREYSGGGAASVTLRILIWRGRQICVRCAPAALTRQKCLCSPPPPRMPKPMYYRCTNPAYARSGAGTCAVRLFYHPAARFATVLCRSGAKKFPRQFCRGNFFAYSAIKLMIRFFIVMSSCQAGIAYTPKPVYQHLRKL